MQPIKPTTSGINLDHSRLLGKTLQGTTMTGEKPDPSAVSGQQGITLDASKLLGNTSEGNTMTGIKPVGTKPDPD
jgi:hypothetical protein